MSDYLLTNPEPVEPQPIAEIDYLFPEEIAEKYRICVETVRRWIRRGVKVGDERKKLPALKVGRQYRVHKSNVGPFYSLCKGA